MSILSSIKSIASKAIDCVGSVIDLAKDVIGKAKRLKSRWVNIILLASAGVMAWTLVFGIIVAYVNVLLLPLWLVCALGFVNIVFCLVVFSLVLQAIVCYLFLLLLSIKSLVFSSF